MPSVSLALSKNQSLDVKVVSYLDMSLLFVLVLVSVTVLILLPRPFLRLRLRALGSGRRPTPDDLEPLTPLSRARKKLIARYMPKPDTGTGPSCRELGLTGSPASALADPAPDGRPGQRRERRTAASEAPIALIRNRRRVVAPSVGSGFQMFLGYRCPCVRRLVARSRGRRPCRASAST